MNRPAKVGYAEVGITKNPGAYQFGPLEPPCGGGSKGPCAALAEDRRGERHGKGAHDASGGDQEDGVQSRLRDRCRSVVI